jgi:hypothetical protein
MFSSSSIVLSLKNIRLHPHLLILVVAVVVASLCTWYSTKVVQVIDGDEIVLIESEKVNDGVENYFNAEVVSAMGYTTYLYPKLVAWLAKLLPIPVYKKILLWFLVFTTLLASYYSLRLLNFTSLISLGVALVALAPRVAPVGEIFGILTQSETMGRSFAVPFFWLLSSWYIYRFQHGLRIEVVFFMLGLLTCVHPATMIMFFVMSIMVHAVLLLVKTSFGNMFRNVFLCAGAYAAGASYVLFEIVQRATQVASIHDPVKTSEYLAALKYRIPWEYLPDSIMWFRHVVIVSTVFFVSLAYAWYRIHQKNFDKKSMEYFIVLYSTWALGIAFVMHLAVPLTQYYVMKLFDAPLVFWQFGRMYKFSYLVLAFVFAVVVTDVRRRFGVKWAFLLLVCGMLCSTFTFEWFQYVVGYKNYTEVYIPASWQPGVVVNHYDEYVDWCDDFTKAGARPGDIVFRDDFNLRHFCDLQPYTTNEEGTGHIFLGKESLVAWHKDMLEQTQILKGEDLKSLIEYGYQKNALFAVVPLESHAVEESKESGRKIIIHDSYAIVDLR